MDHNMTLSDIQTKLYDRLNYGQSPPAEVVRRLLGYINDAQRTVLRTRGLSKLRRTVLTATTVADSPYMVLPQAVVRIMGIQDRTSQKSLKEILLPDIRWMDPGLTRITSSPDCYAVLGFSDGAALQPSAAAQIYVKSTSASDVSMAAIDVVTSAGIPRSATVTMTGTTAVAIGGTDTVEVRKFGIQTSALGTVTMHEGSGGGTELSRIGIGRNSARYTRLHLFGTPSSALTYYVDAEIYVADLVNAWDESFIPVDFHDVLVLGALHREYLKREKYTELNVVKAELKEVMAALIRYAGNRTDDGRDTRSQFSMLGPYFPAGS